MRRFLDAGLEEFVDLVETFDFTRTVTEVHLHPSGRPRQADFLGRTSLQDMWRDHTETQRWSDLAQHVTVDPAGRIWLGRNFNRAPASARGFNGNDRAGPFMVVMIGDFAGSETPTKPQLAATLGAIAAVQRRAGLPAAALRLHEELTGAPCPGLTRQPLIEGLAAIALPPAGARTTGFPDWATRNHELLSALGAVADPPEDMSGAELPHGPGTASPRSGARASEDLSAFADHWINLDRGAFSTEGRLTTTQTDVDRIFLERLPAEIAGAKAQGRALNLLFYAHGGLVSEDVGIAHMTTQTPVWMNNGVYPIFFVWETGFWRSIRDLLAGGRGAREGAPRLPGVDRALEEAARLFGGPSIWDVMKTNALRANSRGGGALYAGGLLKKLMETHKDDLRIHAIGHSAGAIFHAHFLRDLLGDKKRRIETLSLLAPAARADLFEDAVAPLIAGDLIGETTIYTMNDRRERADPSTRPYGKSLLYLIRGALEDEREAEILGLEIGLRGSKALAALFGLQGNSLGRHRVIFAGDSGSTTEAAQAMGRASDAVTHGGFDDDPMTMNSVLRRITGRTQGEPIQAFPPARARAGSDIGAPDLSYLPEELAETLGFLSQTPAPASSPAPAAPAAQPTPQRPAGGGRTGALRALCIGIDDYRDITPLAGCRNDAASWSQAFTGLGYTARVMPQEEATADGLIQQIGDFVAEARAGDSFLLQYSGHGTQFQDATGDDEGDGLDEAICAIDCGGAGAVGLVLDDQLRAIMGRVDPGATLLGFFDSCHSGSVTRLAFERRRLRARAAGGPRIRRVAPTERMRQAYAELLRGDPARRDLEQPMREVVFSACQPAQSAYERDGQGDFTRHALAVLKQGGSRPSNSGFMNAVARHFAGSAVQMPFLDCDPAALEAPLALGAWA
jgi:hypothetical protein